MTATEAPTSVKRTDRPAVLETVASRVRDMLERRGTAAGAADLAQIFEIDVALTGAVFAIARTPLFGPAADATPLGTALERIGVASLTALLRGLPRMTAATPRAAVEEACRRWTQGLATAAAARWLSNQGDFDDPAEAYLCGLAAFSVSDAADARGVRASELAAQWRFGTRVETTLWALRRGGGADVRDGVARRRSEDRALQLLEVVSLAASIVDALGFGPDGRPSPAAPASSQHGATASVREAVALELAHASSLLRLPPGTPEEFAHRLAADELRRLAEAPAESHAGGDAAESVERLARIHGELSAFRADATIHEILQRGLVSVHELLGFDRLVFLERDAARPQTARVSQVFCSAHVGGAGGAAPIEVPADPHSVLARAADARGGTAHRSTGHRSDAPLLSLLGAEDVVVAPVRAGSNAVGLVVADFALRNRAPSDAEVHALGVAAGVLGLVLENAALVVEGRTLRALAEKDELTGISNRRSILDVLRREVDRARRYGKPLSIALVDVDHFKSWNDSHGHAVGDTVLQSVAWLISSVSREIDAYGRYGGEEFLIVLPETSAEHGMIYAERLRTTIEAHGDELAVTYPANSLSVSVGVTQLHARGDDVYEMIARADAALYAAKKHGRNRVCVDVEMPPAPPTLPPVPPPPSRGVLDEL